MSLITSSYTRDASRVSSHVSWEEEMGKGEGEGGREDKEGGRAPAQGRAGGGGATVEASSSDAPV